MKVPEIFIGKRKIVKRNVLQLKKSFSTTNSLVSLFEELPNVLITDEILIACDDISNYRENENVLRLYEVSELFVFFCDFMKQKGQEVKKTLEDFYQEVYKSDWLFLLYLNQIDGIQVWKHNDYFRYLRLLEEKWIEISHLNFIDDRTPKSQNIQSYNFV